MYNRKEPDFVTELGGAGYPIKTKNSNNEIIVIGYFVVNTKNDWFNYIVLNKNQALWDLYLNQNMHEFIYCWVSGGWGKNFNNEPTRLISMNIGQRGNPKMKPMGFVVNKENTSTRIMLQKNYGALKLFTHNPRMYKVNLTINYTISKKRNK
jgi:hypothetical protein